jgi:hypothetical protein
MNEETKQHKPKTLTKTQGLIPCNTETVPTIPRDHEREKKKKREGTPGAKKKARNTINFFENPN